jgi:glutathione S-transferase
MPLLKVNEEGSIGQSAAIYLYLALENGLAGDSHLETAQILSIFEHIKEMTTAYRSLVPAGVEPTSEAIHQWFHEGAKDVTGTADSSLRSSRYLQWWMGRIEQALDANGYAVGNKISAADIALYYSFAEELKANEASETFPQWRREPFGSKALVDEALGRYPKIKASVEAVAQNLNFQKWLSLRGPQGF